MYCKNFSASLDGTLMAAAGEARTRSRLSLVALLQGLQGEETTVELRNDSSVFGMIEHVDCFMNVNLLNATVYPRTPLQSAKNFDRFFVVGKLIRFVHVPDHVDMLKKLERQLDSLSGNTSRLSKEERTARISGKKSQKQRRQDLFGKHQEALKAQMKQTAQRPRDPSIETGEIK